MDRAAGSAASRIYRDLLDQVCGHEHDEHRHTPSSLTKLTKRLGCSLAAPEREHLFRTLRGQHIHIWREDDGYSILVASQEPLNVLHARTHIGAAMGALAKWRLRKGVKLLFDVRGFTQREAVVVAVFSVEQKSDSADSHTERLREQILIVRLSLHAQVRFAERYYAQSVRPGGGTGWVHLN